MRSINRENKRNTTLVACSNGLSVEKTLEIQLLRDTLKKLDICTKTSKYIFEKQQGISGTGKEKAENLMEFFCDKKIEDIFDISGGDLANELLPYLDFEKIKDSKATFWGYSDLTTIINAIYTKTGKESVLYQIRNLIYDYGKKQKEEFSQSFLYNKSDLFSVRGQFVQGEKMQGILVGGNIRCFLKLAGTEFFPDMKDKVLLLEARSGKVPQMITYLSHLKMLGVFEKISGLVLGTFTQMEQEKCKPDMIKIVLDYVKESTPVFKTDQIGHGTDSKAVVIGREVLISRNLFLQ
ncbi:hypothetical protein BHF70_00240 [Anaerostipes sp. 494a]|uniref:LD-carboxypeptidase n=1 Tax=Anaerostipes sp. 494a TaxID=1261636 RepID=UPI000952E1FC|nr:LD-carboxypeptidase [Anaerostipes sp. 494a]OLR58191.1 hypothetical protein BHF70_00240 [Anaerostipes sp. 494a]